MVNSGQLAMLQALLGGRKGSVNTLRPSYDDERQRDPMLLMGREMMASRPQGDDIGSAISSAVEKLAGAYMMGKREKEFRGKEAKLGADWEHLSPRAWGASVIPATGAQIERAKAAEATPAAFAGPTRGGGTLEQEMIAQGKPQEQAALTMAELANMEGVDPRIKDALSSVIMAREGQEKMEKKEQQRYDEARSFQREQFDETRRMHEAQMDMARQRLALSSGPTGGAQEKPIYDPRLRGYVRPDGTFTPVQIPEGYKPKEEPMYLPLSSSAQKEALELNQAWKEAQRVSRAYDEGFSAYGPEGPGIGQGTGFDVSMMGADIANRVDPQGTGLRSAVNQMSSVIMNQLSGAAVSEAERKRLEGFLPTIRDDERTLRQKLVGYDDYINSKAEAWRETYGDSSVLQGIAPRRRQQTGGGSSLPPGFVINE